jgi:hypothetical protein
VYVQKFYFKTSFLWDKPSNVQPSANSLHWLQTHHILSQLTVFFSRHIWAFLVQMRLKWNSVHLHLQLLFFEKLNVENNLLNFFSWRANLLKFCCTWPTLFAQVVTFVPLSTPVRRPDRKFAFLLIRSCSMLIFRKTLTRLYVKSSSLKYWSVINDVTQCLFDVPM